MARRATPSADSRRLASPQSTPFLGREQELAEVLKRLKNPDCRLLSLIGPGGIGKTRLAFEVASRLDGSEEFPQGAYLVPLQSMTDGSFLASAIAEQLAIGLSGAEAPSTQLLNYLRDKQILLILDNMEHIGEERNLGLIIDIIQEAPGVTMLTTTRRVLQLRQEWRYPIQGLPVPAAGDIDNAQAYDAVRLFINCAQRVQPAFSDTDELPGIVRICQLVGGMPLAIELAAGWRRSMDSQSIAREIEKDLDILQTEMQDVPERHRSMRAVFDHTWRSLDEEARSVFASLSVFRGGFEREAAEQVAEATLPILSRLVDLALVHYGPDQRYTLHELLRQYGEEKLSRSPTQQNELSRRHADYYTEFLHRHLNRVQGSDQKQAVMQINTELQNVRETWRWLVDQSDVKGLHRAATTYFLYCQQKCSYLEGANALAQAAASLEGQPPSHSRDITIAQLLNHEGWLRIRVGEFDKARSLLERSCSLYDRLNVDPPPHMGGASEVPLALVAVIQGEFNRALRLVESARRASEEREDQHNLAFSHYALSAANLALGEYEAARAHAQKSARLARSLGNRWFLGYPLNEWGKAALALGDRSEARRQFRASFAIKREFNDAEGMAVALNHLGDIARLKGEFTEAQEAFDRSLKIYQTLNDHGGLATSYRGLARVALSKDEIGEARDCFLESLRIANSIRYLPLLFSLLVDVAPLLRRLEEWSLAVRLLSFVRQAPASDHEARNRASRQLKHYEPQLTPEDYAREMQQGEIWDLEAAITTLQTTLATPQLQVKQSSSAAEELIEPLTEREAEVLGLLAQGLSNAQIAEDLVLAVGTVKWYASQIYGKLGVSNRTEAAARARELGLL